ncbi:hypothetical protein EES40_36565 [Streptomyces sp. ADI93-02]|nr:hypothetical protein EES40_36565 [Streptomyces sp. ADI93-02]
MHQTISTINWTSCPIAIYVTYSKFVADDRAYRATEPAASRAPPT